MGDNRVIVLVDMDCFYCQVEAKLNPDYKGKPLAVVQYNDWRGGGIIAVNYEARDKGVKRGMRGDQARKLCPDIVLAKVAEVRGKADLTKYRDAGKEVVKVFHNFSDCIERASIDEAYIDITKSVEKHLQEITESETGISPSQLSSTFIIGFSDNKSNDEEMRATGLKTWMDSLTESNRLRLAVGALIVEEMRAAVFQRTSFRCSAGISYNKILAKLVCGIHKPNRQTVLPPEQVDQFFTTLPIQKVRNLGGKFGTEVVERFGCQTMGDLARVSLRDLQKQYDEKTGAWLYNVARGIDNDPVTVRLIPKSIGCSKNFPGKTALATKSDVEHWMRELISELVVRLTEDQEENKRRAQLLTVMVGQDTDDNSSGSTSRSGALPGYNVDRIVSSALALISKTNSAPSTCDAWFPPLKHLSCSAGKFIEDSSLRNTSIHAFFKQIDKEESSISPDSSIHVANKCFSSMTSGKDGHQESEETVDVCCDTVGSVSASKPSTSSMLWVSKSKGESHGTANENVANNLFKTQGTGFGTVDDMTVKTTVAHTEKVSERTSQPNAFPVVCPDDLESAAHISFFARYIIQMKRSKDPKNQDTTGKTCSEASNLDVSAGTIQEKQTAKEENIEDVEKCGECGEIVLLQNFPEHVDYHSALKLQKELNASLTPPETIASEKNDNEKKFPDGPSKSVNNDDLVEKCSYCGKHIPLNEFPEHVDYHSALQLQKELNQSNNLRSHASTSSHSTNASVLSKKRKGRLGKQGPSPSKKIKANTIASFFMPK